MMKKVKILNIIRILACVPFGVLIAIATFNSINGVSAFTSYAYGYDAFVLTLMAGGMLFFGVWALAFVVIIVTSIMIHQEKKNAKKEEQ